MTHNDKIHTLMVAINDNIVLPDVQKKVIASALVEGFIKILMVEDAEKKAAQPYAYFPVELAAAEGFCIWNSGGYNPVKQHGTAQVCVGLDGNHTRVIRSAAEENGRHLLTLVYQGCYVLSAEVWDVTASAVVRGYQVLGFTNGRDGSYLARCRKVFDGPAGISKLQIPEDARNRIHDILCLCGDMAISTNLKRMEWRL